MTNVSTIPREEETCSQPPLLRVVVGNGTGNCGLPSARHTVQPEDALSAVPISPCHYLIENANACSLEANRIMLILVGVEGGCRNIW
jgi:hypothetical protein